ncbi:Pimeloyl-ACP methyl ester carboxylesterase [Cryobacterium flavum]|nr:alpha/beta hydrolase [Cryobacterium flavum]SDO23906.1 Pimeloyl-ACP methyl ester carboxylesterase [Cryobacterium flavum]
MGMVREQWINAAGVRTRYLEAGDPARPTVLLLHDGAWGGSSSTTWGNAISLLATAYHVLAPDQLGFGGTDKLVHLDRSPYDGRIAHITEFLDALRIPTVHLVGNSFGGSLALRILCTPLEGRVRSAVSISGTGGPWRTPLAHENLSYWDGTRNGLERVVSVLIDRESGYFEDQLDERYRWAIEPGHYRSVMALSIPIPPAIPSRRPLDPWPKQLAECDIPVLLVSGDRDVLLEKDWTNHLVEVLSNSAVERIDSMHEPNIDRPDLLVSVVLTFLRRQEQHAGSPPDSSVGPGR